MPTAHAIHFPFTTDRPQGDALYQQAYAAYQAGDYPQAQTLIEKADKFKPDQPDGWNLRGMVYLKQNAFDKAEVAFARAVALDPKLWAAQFNLAEAPFQGKDYARARGRFERLLGQTDRFKQEKQWELVEFKAFMSCMLMGDEANALKKMSKLPATGGVTPANLYAQAALSFHRKDAAAAEKSLAAAQTAFSPSLNDLFSDSLVEAGWTVAPPPPTLAVNPPPPVRSSSPGRSSSSVKSSSSAGTLPYMLSPSAPQFADKYAPVVIDPKMEGSGADPLPLAGGANVRPMLGKVNPMPPRPVPKTVVAAPLPPVSPTPPPPDDALQHRGLLLE